MAITSQEAGDLMIGSMQRALNEQMLAVAEPLIAAAVKDIEQKMREKMAQNLISVLQSSYSMERAGNILHIKVSI